MNETSGVTYPCPACGARADLTAGCPGCGRAPDPDAAEVARLDGVITRLSRQARREWDAHQATLAELTEAQWRRSAAADRVRAGLAPPRNRSRRRGWRHPRRRPVRRPPPAGSRHCCS